MRVSKRLGSGSAVNVKCVIPITIRTTASASIAHLVRDLIYLPPQVKVKNRLLAWVFSELATGLRVDEFLQELQCFRRFGSNCVIRVDFRRADDAVRVDDVTCRHGQAVFRFVMKPVEGAPERFVEVTQIVWKGEDESELFCDPKVKIGQNIESQLQLFVQRTRIPFQFWSQNQDARSLCPDLEINFL